MYSTHTSGVSLDANVATQYERASGPHFSGAPAAVLNPGPSGTTGMAVFGTGGVSGELMFSASDDHLHSEAVAPVMYPFAVYSGIDDAELPMMLPKGTIVNISDAYGADARMKKKADRAGKSLRRLTCAHCDDARDVNGAELLKSGIVGVLAEAALMKKDQFTMVTVALENATEVKLDIDGERNIKAGETMILRVKGCKSYRFATALTGYHHKHNDDIRKVPGGHFCLHPGLFKIKGSTGVESGDAPLEVETDLGGGAEEVTTDAPMRRARTAAAAASGVRLTPRDYDEIIMLDY